MSFLRLCLCLLACPLIAQPVVFKRDIAKQWIGGLNAPQVQKMLLNADTIADLVVFDRTASRFFTFLATPDSKGNLQWVYNPAYESIFPRTVGWFLLRDYNRDGIQDFFAHAPDGIQVWQGTKIADKPAFIPITQGLTTKGLSGKINLQVAITDIPCIHDIDGDGDLDILTFDFSQGSYIELHLNNGTEDRLSFERQGYCWGNIWEGNKCGEMRFDYPCAPAGKGGGESNLPAKTLHAGSTITISDLNNDKRLDLLVGDVSCKRLYAVYNKGTNLKPVFAKYDTLFPASKPVDIHVFPASFIEDVDFDGIADLLVAPNTFLNEQNDMDFQHALWFYKGSKKKKKNKYMFLQTDFLQKEMIDVGENATPLFLDADLDDDFDLIIGNRGLKTAGKFAATLHLFENIGNKHKPQFVLKDADWRGLQARNLTDIKPFIAPNPTTKKNELHVIAQQNRQAVWLVWQEGSWKNRTHNLNKRAFPILYDFDEDNTLDMLITENQTPTQYYKKTIDKQAKITPNIDNAVIADINADGKPDCLAVYEGALILYSDIHTQWQASSGNWLGDNALVFNEIDNNTTAYNFGAFAFPATADLDADGRLDLIVGLRTGGVCLYWNKATR